MCRILGAALRTFGFCLKIVVDVVVVVAKLQKFLTFRKPPLLVFSVAYNTEPTIAVPF